ncbi:hypothetical protein BDZ97DRAFT_1834589 [Flammula alnicola]|nr:hypothetical protein BDZ97DRAFT_1834589 [Flammula alnicola]
MPNPFATQEPPAALWFEQANNAAVYLGAIAYGMHILVFFTCAYYLLHEKNKNNWRWLIFIFVLFSLATCNLAFNVHFNELAWIDDRNYPGGPLMFILEQQTLPFNIAGNAVTIVITFMADALLIYRVHILYNKWWAILVPILMWLASIATGILFTVQAALPNSSLWANSTLNFSVPFFSLAMALSILLTGMLVLRLLYMRREITKVLGPHHGKAYTGIAAMMLETAAPYGIFSFIFIVLYAKKNTAANLFIPLLSQVEGITPMLIILRVSRGRAWSGDTVTEAIKFSNNNGSSGSSTAGDSGRRKGTHEVSLMTFKAMPGTVPDMESVGSAVSAI